MDMLVKKAGRAGAVDQIVGYNIRTERVRRGMSQQDLADAIGITYQQAHKYERGINRVSAGRLYEISKVLGLPVQRLFDGLDNDSAPKPAEGQRMCLELARNFAQIPDERQRLALSQLARALATGE